MSRWPECYAGHCPNTNMALEHFHSELKNLHMNRGQHHRFDSIIKMLLDKTYADLNRRMLTILKNPHTNRDRQVRKFHESGVKIPPTDISAVNGKWIVRSQTDKEVTYEVSLLQPCPGRATCLRCHNCQVCHHMTKCTCPHYSRGNVCKHIHAICHRNPEIVAARFPKISREERLQELHELAPLRAARHPNELQEARAKAEALLATTHHMDDDAQREVFQAVIVACSSPKTPQTPRLHLETTATPRRSTLPIHQQITPQRRRPVINRKLDQLM